VQVAMGKRIALYKLGRELGAGNFAKVKAGIHVLAKEKVAVKIVDRAKLDTKTLKLLTREISNMDLLHHTHIIKLFEVWTTVFD
jgi:serine/threonine-protein kinase NIM1